MVTIDVNKNKVKVCGFGEHEEFISKEFSNKDKFFSWLNRKIEKGIILFTNDDELFIKYKNLDDGNEYSIDVSDLSDVEKKIFDELIEYSNTSLIKNKRNAIIEKKEGKRNSLSEVFKNNVVRMLNGYGYWVTNLFGLSGTLSILSLTMRLNGGSVSSASTISLLPLAFTVAMPIVKSYFNAKDTLSNNKYQLTEEEFKEYSKQKTHGKEKDLEQKLEVLKRIENEDLPTMDKYIIDDLDYINKLLDTIEDKNDKIKFLSRIKAAMDEYKKNDDFSQVSSDISLTVADKYAKSMKFYSFLENLKRELQQATKKSEVDNKITEFEDMYSKIMDGYTDDLGDSGVCKLSK